MKSSIQINCRLRRRAYARQTHNVLCVQNAEGACPLHPMVNRWFVNIARAIRAIGFSPQLANEKDFITAMATLRGHGKPLNQQVFHCEGCGSEFILPPQQISSSCIYCDSPHVVSLEDTKDLLAPDGILPHMFNQQRATKLLMDWVGSNKIKPERKVDLPRGLYLPVVDVRYRRRD